MKKFLNRFFKLEERGSNVKREIIAGLITFLSMAYILFVNPTILAESGMDAGGVFTATVIAAIIATLLMGIYANYPVALAPGMGMNAMFTYTICLTFGYSWQQALFFVFISGVIFLLISLTGVRKAIINAIPNSIKKATGAGIGLFIAFIGLQKSGIIISSGATLVQFGDLTNPITLLAIFGIILTVVLYLLKIKGSIIIGIASTAVLGCILQLCGVEVGVQFGEGINAFISTPKAPAFGKLFTGWDSFKWDFSAILVIFSLLFLDFFDTAGTLVSVGGSAGLIDENGELKDCDKALLCDATATVVGAIVGTSSTTSYVESMAGIEAGGRTGLTAVVVAICFAFSLFFSPLLSVVTSACTCCALVMVGILMLQQVKDIEWDDLSAAVPAFFTIILMPLAYSIAVGIAVGFIFYTICKIATKKIKEVTPIMWVLTVLFLLYFVVTAIMTLVS